MRDERGGVAQALIEVRRRGGRDERDENECTVEARTHSVAGGGFELGPLCPGQYDVRATRSTQVATLATRLARGPRTAPLSLLLREGTHLTVRVRDPARAVVFGAEVQTQDEESGYLAEATSDADGTAVFDGLAPRPHTVRAAKPNYLDASLHDRTLAAGDDQVELTLSPGVFFSGRVVDPEGSGVDDVWVRLALRRKELGGGYDTVEGTSTADGGEFSIGLVRPGPYTLVATHPLFTRLEQPVRAPGPRATFRLERGATVVGEFLDPDGAPVTQGDVHAELGAHGDSRNTEVDEWGRFTLEGLAPGVWAVVGVTRPEDGGQQGLALTQLSVGRQPKLSVTLQLTRGERIEGRCVNADGSKADTEVAAVEVSLWTTLRLSGFDPTRVPPGTVALSACNDRFALEGLRPGRYAIVACGNDESPELANAGDRDVTVRCREGSLRFRVVDPNGRPVETYTVGGDVADEKHPGGIYQRALIGEVDEVLTVRAPGFAPLQRKLTGSRGSALDLGDLMLTGSRRLVGRVVDRRDGRPVSGAELRFGVDDPMSAQRGRSRADGSFELLDLPREGAKLFVAHPAYRLAAIEVPPSQEQLTVSLLAGLELSGAVITRDGREPVGYTVEARGLSGPLRTTEVVAGRYGLGSIEPGDWNLRLVGPDVSGFDPISLTLVGSGGVSKDFVERLGGVSVGVLPLDADGRPVVALVWLLPGRRARPPSDAEAWALSAQAGLGSEGDPSGAHAFTAVPPGPYTVLVRARDVPGLFWLEPLEVSPGMASQVRLPMPRGLSPVK